MIDKIRQKLEEIVMENEKLNEMLDESEKEVWLLEL